MKKNSQEVKDLTPKTSLENCRRATGKCMTIIIMHFPTAHRQFLRDLFGSNLWLLENFFSSYQGVRPLAWGASTTINKQSKYREKTTYETDMDELFSGPKLLFQVARVSNQASWVLFFQKGQLLKSKSILKKQKASEHPKVPQGILRHPKGKNSIFHDWTSKQQELTVF